MQTISLHHHHTNERTENLQLAAFIKWFESIKPVVVENRFGVVAALILLQITIAGFNVVIPPMAGASVYVMAPGISLAFLSNSMALAQMRMRWVLICFALSMVVNAAVSVYYIMQLL